MADGKPDLEIVEARAFEIRRPRATLLTLPSSPARTESSRRGSRGSFPSNRTAWAKSRRLERRPSRHACAGVLL